jgi:hypothetical protein
LGPLLSVVNASHEIWLLLEPLDELSTSVDDISLNGSLPDIDRVSDIVSESDDCWLAGLVNFSEVGIVPVVVESGMNLVPDIRGGPVIDGQTTVLPDPGLESRGELFSRVRNRWFNGLDHVEGDCAILDSIDERLHLSSISGRVLSGANCGKQGTRKK